MHRPLRGRCRAMARSDPEIDFQAIFDAAPGPYLLLNADPPQYSIADVNRAYLAATGTERAAMIGRGLFEVFPENPGDRSEDGPGELRISLDRVLRDGVADAMGVQKYDIPLRDGSGRFEVRYWSPINTPIKGADGRISHILHRVEDVTEFILSRDGLGPAVVGRSRGIRERDSIEAEVRRSGAELKEANRQLKTMSEQLVEANARLENLDRLKTEFFANVSHEFRTPLTLMLGPLEEMLSRPLSTEDRPLLEGVQRNALRLQKLVNALLDFSRLEEGRVKARFEKTDLAALTMELASHFDSACSEAGIALKIDCAIDDPVPVDREMWEKIVLNLISNAFKFTLEGEIAISLRQAGGMAKLTVRDSGVGIPAEELPLVFERFHRVKGQGGRSHEGSGIGLSLVRELVRLHDGQITAESQPGQGTSFVVTIPLRRAAEDVADGEPLASSKDVRAVGFAREAEHWLPASHDAPLADMPEVDGAGAGRRVLLADDNADMRAYVGRILIGAGYEVHAVPDVDAVFAALRERPHPDLILSDVMMPGALDGFGLLRALRADPATETLPVMLLSARAGPEARIEGLEAGADEYVVKPFGARELLARIDAALRLGKMRREAALKERELETARAEAKLRLAMETARMGEVIFDLSADTIMHTPGFAMLFGQSGDQQMTLDDIRSAYHPDDRATMENIRARTLIGDTEYLEAEHRVIWPDGSIHWLAARFHIERDGNGRATEATAVYMDITERKWVEERQRLLLDELNHRVKNTLSTVQSIAMQTRRSAASPEQFSELFEGRITALAGAHDLLTEASWEGASLADVIGRTLSPYALSASDGAPRIIFGGPQVMLSPNAAVTLNMAFHELATNAAKYGALSVAEGRLDVCWTVDRSASTPVVELFWNEQGGPLVTPPARRGFGTRLVEQGLTRELDGEVDLRYDPDGFKGVVRLPASHKVSPL